jgi:Protein of unknown function (DUF1254)/Sulfatase
MDTPFQWTKQVASHFGGTRNPLILSWPARIEDKGGLRDQFLHTIDIVPTLYELIGITPPVELNGVQQKPIEGISFAYTFDDAQSRSRRITQYFELGGNRGIYHDGWMASAISFAPWEPNRTGFDPDKQKWELYNDLPRSAGIPAQLANEAYAEALARIVYYWAYPAIDVTSRTTMWELMKEGPGLMFGIAPGSPVNDNGCLSGYLPPAQRIVVTPNNDTFYGVALLDLGREPVVVQTPADVPEGHYWVMQIADVFTNVVRTLGSAWATPGGKFLLVGPDWLGDKPEGFIEVIRLPTNYGGVFPRSLSRQARSRSTTPSFGERRLSRCSPPSRRSMSNSWPASTRSCRRISAGNTIWPFDETVVSGGVRKCLTRPGSR